MKLVWVPMLVAPAAVVFVATRTTVDPLAKTERIDVSVPHAELLPQTLPGVVLSDVSPTRPKITVKTPSPAPKVAPKKRPVVRTHTPTVVRPERPVYVVKPVRIRVIIKTVVVVQKPSVAPLVKPSPKPAPLPAPTPTPTPTPTPAPTPLPEPTPVPEPTPPPTPAPTPTPTPQAPPTPPTPPTPTPTPTPAAPPPTPTQPCDDNSRPGNGWGDSNHDHTGPPGHDHDHDNGGDGGHGHGRHG